MTGLGKSISIILRHGIRFFMDVDTERASVCVYSLLNE